MTSIRERMTNPFAIITLHAINSYHKVVSSNQYQQTVLPKILIYTVGTSLLATAATVIYKTMKKNARATATATATATTAPLPHHPKQKPYNFLYTISQPLQYLLYKIKGRSLSSANTITETNTPTPFEDKYFNEYDDWTKSTDTNETSEDHKKECLENMYYSTVRETINEFYGDVIMCYDHKTLSFAYYARTGSIPYKYLETISRKYMIETNAPREIHVDIRSEYNKAKDRTNESFIHPASIIVPNVPTTPTTDESDTEAENTDVFVKLKSYNNATNLKIHTNTNDKTSSENKSDPKTDSNIILRENANRYSYRGKIEDFEEHHTTFLAQRRSAPASAYVNSTISRTTTHDKTTRYAEFRKQYMKSAL